MVKICSSIVGFLCATLLANAQRFSVEAHGTYQLPIGGTTQIREDWQDLDDTTRVGEYHRVNVNWGTGPGAGLALRMSVSDRLQVELRGTFFPGSCTSWKSTFRGGDLQRSITSRFLRVEPAVRLLGGEGRVSWHLVAGPSIVLAPRSVSRSTYTSDYWGLTEGDIEWTEEGGAGFGAFAGVGVGYAPFRNWSFFGEVTGTAQSWSPRRGRRTKEVQNGVDVLPMEPTYSRETEYVNSYRTDDAYNPDEPTKALRFHYPMSSWGIRIGVNYTFHRRDTTVESEEN